MEENSIILVLDRQTSCRNMEKCCKQIFTWNNFVYGRRFEGYVKEEKNIIALEGRREKFEFEAGTNLNNSYYNTAISVNRTHIYIYYIVLNIQNVTFLN